MAQVLRVSIKGGLPNGEEWSVNPVWSIGGDFGTPVSAVQAQTIANALAAIAVPSGVHVCWSTSTNLTQYRVEARSLAGILEAQAEGVRATPQGGSGGTPHPFQTSSVISLRSGTPGPSGRGRLYAPATGMAIDVATLRMAAAAAGGLITGWKTFLSAIETAIEATLPGVSLAVWSRKGTGALSPVTSLELGNVFDVQRRRRDTLIEGRTVLTYP